MIILNRLIFELYTTYNMRVFGNPGISGTGTTGTTQELQELQEPSGSTKVRKQDKP